MTAWVLSQNGLVAECPHRHGLYTSPTSKSSPSRHSHDSPNSFVSMICFDRGTPPVTTYGPFLVTKILMSFDSSILPSLQTGDRRPPGGPAAGASALALVAFQKLASDHQLLDLTGALPDQQERRVSI